MEKDYKIIAVDFDGTLCENEFPEIGKANNKLIIFLKRRKRSGDKLILWTNRVDDKLKVAVSWCGEKGLIFDAVNKNLPEVVEYFGGDTRKIYADEYIDDKNVLMETCREKSEIVSWAEREIELACKLENPDRKEGEWDYGCACYESALKAFKSIANDGHSDASIIFTKQIFNRLIDYRPLTPIEDIRENWIDVSENRDGSKFQCLRFTFLFKEVNKTNGDVIFKDLSRAYHVYTDDPDNMYRSNFTDRIINEMYPITMPYIPEDNPYKIFLKKSVDKSKPGDLSRLIKVLYIIEPGGKEVPVNRYFTEGAIAGSFTDISRTEYKRRKRCKNLF